MPSRHSPQRWRWMMGLLAGVCLGAGVLLVLILAPPIQGWLVRKFVGSHPGWKVDFERIGLGPTGFGARGLEFVMPGVQASSAPITIQVAPLRLFRHRELQIEQVEAQKIRLTLTPADLVLQNHEPFEGVLRLLQSPLRWQLNEARLDGDIFVRDRGETRLSGNFSLHGGGLSAVTPGNFNYELSANSMILPLAPEHRFKSSGSIRVEQTPQHGVARIVLEGDLLLPRYGALSLPPGHIRLEIVASPTGEIYRGKIALGSGVLAAFDATLDASHSRLTGRIDLHADQSAFASLLSGHLPRFNLSGKSDFTLDLRTGALDLALSGEGEARAWENVIPELADVDALLGHLTADIRRRGDQVELASFAANIHAENDDAEFNFSLSEPLELPLRNSARGRLTLDHWPLPWLNPFTVPKGIKLGEAEFSAEWGVAFDSQHTLELLPIGQATIGPLTLMGPRLPPLPRFNLAFRPTITASAESINLSVENFTAISSEGDRVEGNLVFSRDLPAGKIQSTGQMKASLPTLLAPPNSELPFHLETSWDAELSGAIAHFSALQFQASSPSRAKPFAVLTQERSFDFDLVKHRTLATPTVGSAPAHNRLARIQISGFPLFWLNRWVQKQNVQGEIIEGESALQFTSTGGLEWVTTTPWKIDRLAFGPIPDAPVFAGTLQLAPAFNQEGDKWIAQFNGLEIDSNQNQITGMIGANGDFSLTQLAGDLTFQVHLPTLPGSKESFGALDGRLRTQFHHVANKIFAADQFSARLENHTGQFVSVDSPQPFVFGLSNTGMVAVSTLAPLEIRVSSFPLSWFKRAHGTIAFDGQTDPLELRFSAAINQYSLRPAQPWHWNNVKVRQGDQVLSQPATLTFAPSADFTFLCATEPTLQLAYVGTAKIEKFEWRERNVVLNTLDLSLGFKGNQTVLLPDAIDFTSRVDFASFANGNTIGLPRRGVLETTVKGDLLGGKPIALHTRLTDVPAADGPGVIPPFEVDLRGKITSDDFLRGRVKMLLAAAPQPSDAEFDLKMNLDGGALNITSGLHSHFMDGAGLIALVRAFPAATPTHHMAVPLPKIIAAKVPNRPAGPVLPFWGALRGSFTLESDALQFTPYRIEHVRGRLDADATTLALHDLHGEMFAGTWGGNVQFHHEPSAQDGKHTLRGNFEWSQLESARVVQTVFPHQLASVEAKIDVQSHVSSQGNSFVALLDHSVAEFTMESKNGTVHLTVPKANTLSTAAVFGGTVLLSPELRALGKLLKKFAEMPVDQLRIAGRRTEDGSVTLDEFRFESPQARLIGYGHISPDEHQPFMNRPLTLSLELGAKDDLAVILNGMKLLDQKPQPDGFRLLRQPFTLMGRAGAPDTTPFYDLLAQGVSGSHGTWGYLMRKAQAQIAKKKAP